MDNLYFSTAREEYVFYLAKYDGRTTFFQPWTDLPTHEFQSSCMTGVDDDERPYVLVISDLAGKWSDYCFLRREKEGVRSEFVAHYGDQAGNYYNDQVALSAGAVGAVADLLGHKNNDDTLYHFLRLFVRQPE